MYGMVNRSIQDMVETQHGTEVWARVLEHAGVDIEVFVSSEGYPDEITYGLVAAASAVLGVPASRVLEDFGVHWIMKTAAKGTAT